MIVHTTAIICAYLFHLSSPLWQIVLLSAVTLDHLAAEGGSVGTKINIVSERKSREGQQEARWRKEGGECEYMCMSVYMHVSLTGTALRACVRVGEQWMEEREDRAKKAGGRDYSWRTRRRLFVCAREETHILCVAAAQAGVTVAPSQLSSRQ